MPMPNASSLAIPAVLTLIAFLSYSSQYLFYYLEPGSLSYEQSWIFNVLLVCLLISYGRACSTDPGRIPPKWEAKVEKEVPDSPDSTSAIKSRQRWCRKCEAAKPPRAHHCKVCRRCIPKMDHHCPWTANCVSHLTFPHFIRFLFYAVAAMSYLQYFLYIRCRVIWNSRHHPSYLGPTTLQLVHLFLLLVANFVMLFALSIMLIRTIWCLGSNTTTIEGWEIERHETLLRRSRYLGGYLNGPDGRRIRIVRQEFPYDIGIWQNFRQGMNTANILAWFWPLSATPRIESGLDFEVNGFEDPSVSWPPPDPDRMPKMIRNFNPDDAFVHGSTQISDSEWQQAFNQRQKEDFSRREREYPTIHRRKMFHERYSTENGQVYERESSLEDSEDGEGEESWRNSEGERLDDFGVDENVEFYDEEDDIPLGELLRRRNPHAASEQ